MDFFSGRKSEALLAIEQIKLILKAEDPLITGFNIGINCGASAGQTIFHCHVHFIPRRDGDSKDPRGGVRGVIPDRQRYGSELL